MTAAKQITADDGSDFAACVRLLQAAIADGADAITLSRADAKAISREIMRLQEINAHLSGALTSATFEADEMVHWKLG